MKSKLELAREQLGRVQVAAIDPVDWSDLTIYGFHAVENAVVAAADAVGLPWQKTHPSKLEVARTLAAEHGLPSVAGLLVELNTLRKSEAYGEVGPSDDTSAEDIAIAVEEYVEAVASFIEGVEA